MILAVIGGYYLTIKITGVNDMENMEHQFIDRLRSGDASSYEILVRNYGGRMLSVARRYLKSEADAQDCVQDAYIQAFRNIGKFEGRSTLET